jgi:hypothetical protein
VLDFAEDGADEICRVWRDGGERLRAFRILYLQIYLAIEEQRGTRNEDTNLFAASPYMVLVTMGKARQNAVS